jgi:hypothetical protein
VCASRDTNKKGCQEAATGQSGADVGFFFFFFFFKESSDEDMKG